MANSFDPNNVKFRPVFRAYTQDDKFIADDVTKIKLIKKINKLIPDQVRFKIKSSSGKISEHTNVLSN